MRRPQTTKNNLPTTNIPYQLGEHFVPGFNLGAAAHIPM